MQFIAGAVNNKFLIDVLNRYTPKCTRVKAAIAYADKNNMLLFEKCKSLNKPLDFFGRYDESVPISPEILEWFLKIKNPNFQCRVVPDLLHSKVIWWQGEGAYIGSANLTDQGWFRNIESGIALTNADLIESGMSQELAVFFENVSKNSEALTKEIYQEQLEFYKNRPARVPSTSRRLKKRDSLLLSNKESAQSRALRDFKKDWNDTVETMRYLASECASKAWRPAWVGSEASGGVLADRFLHIYYVNVIRDGSAYPIEPHYDKNHHNPDAAVQQALSFWKESNYKQDFEYSVIIDWAPRLQELLAQNRISELTKEEFVELVSYVHSMRDHARKCPKELLGIVEENPDEPTPEELMTEKFAEWLWNNHVNNELCLLRTMNFVIWGTVGDIADRLWEATHSTQWKIPRVGISALGEIVGWARPNDYPPRNQRTSKTLRALGFDVSVY